MLKQQKSTINCGACKMRNSRVIRLQIVSKMTSTSEITKTKLRLDRTKMIEECIESRWSRRMKKIQKPQSAKTKTAGTCWSLHYTKGGTLGGAFSPKNKPAHKNGKFEK
jgi:hypothetical protein